MIFEDEHGLHLQTADQAVREAQQLFGKYQRDGRSMVDELIADRRREAECE